MKLDRWRKLAMLCAFALLGTSLLSEKVIAQAEQYDNTTQYVATITDAPLGRRRLTITGSRQSLWFWSGQINYSATSRPTPYRNWSRLIPFWSRQNGGPGLEHHRDLMEMFDLPQFLPRINGPVTVVDGEDEVEVENARIRDLTIEYQGGWGTPPGDFLQHQIDEQSVTEPQFYLPTGEDAYDILHSRLTGLGIEETHVLSFMRGEITPEQLVELANGYRGRGDDGSSDDITLGDVLDALGNIRVSIGLQIGFKFATERDGKIALKFIIGIEMDVKDLATVAAYGMQPAVRKVEETMTEATDLTRDLAELQRSLNDDGQDPQDPKPPRPWYQDFIDVWGGFFE